MKQFEQEILKKTSASALGKKELIQALWSGYGSIYRINLIGAEQTSIVAKHVHFPNQINHPRGWHNDFSHQRKLKSYEVEMNWYAKYAQKCNEKCRVPKVLMMKTNDEEVFIVLEDLNSSGYPERKSAVTWKEMVACIKWLANFHAVFLGSPTNGLWETGTYWHLETRPDELQALDDRALKEHAGLLDQKLKATQFQTLVHGDAKLANFCFSEDGEDVSAVDFQYVGGGCGMKDLAYFVGSCFYEEDCEKYESAILDEYFDELKAALQRLDAASEFLELEREWRALYPLAWTDFHRFIKGWSPGHWKINSYSERMAREVIRTLHK